MTFSRASAFLPALVLAAFLAIAFGGFAADKPNVLFIAIDDQNDWIGYLGGHPDAKTPNIDALAGRGTAFTNAHCQAPLCNPSRTSLLTGKRPSSTGIYGLAPWIRTVEEFKDVVTLPQHFMKNGYRTYYTGKIFHGGYSRGKGDLGKEWDVIGVPASGGPFPPRPLVKTPSGHKLVDWGVFPHKDEDKGDWKVAGWAVEQLDSMQKERPFFLACGFFLPHVPCFTTQKWYDLHPETEALLPKIRRDDRDDTPRFSWYLHWKLPEPRLKFLEENDQWVNLVRSYLACTSFVDSQVGRVLEAVQRNGFAENTVVVLWSDHGWHLGEKLITGKNTLWDDGTRVPLVFAGPGVTPGQRCGRPAELLDIYPTLIELCGLSAREGLEGHSLMPQLRDAAAPREWPAITTHNHDNHGVRSEKWRYIVYADGSEELYDMTADPNEWTNLAGDPKYADVVAEHRKYLPKSSRKPAPGSASRVLIYENGKANWEGEDIDPKEPVPEL
ncbi:MAG: sulfatase [Verrucomicrobiae bacterium]|nr:sulfatase [Verrucomicrobiae bacterium]MCP5539441.1 sulfatase [Akkermansiaceae bacterium]